MNYTRLNDYDMLYNEIQSWLQLWKEQVHRKRFLMANSLRE